MLPSSSSRRRRRTDGRSVLLGAGAAAAWGVQGAQAYSFNFQQSPQQCANLSLAITGSGGNPPYRALVIPFGGTPLPNSVEVRKILEETFDGTQLSFQLKYPANSQFVVVVSDATTFGNGGTSAVATVGSSSDSSCFNATTSVSPGFFFNVDPPNQVVQCNSSRLWWDPATVQGTPTFYGVIPGGESFNITVGALSTIVGEGVGFNWTANVRSGTTLMLGAGDSRGVGAGGSETYIVSNGLFPDSSCLNDDAPSSTAGSPAGGAFATSTSGSDSGSGAGGSANAGAIAGGVVGGIVVVVAGVLLVLFFRRRRRFHRRQMKERPDLFTDGEGAPGGEMQGLAAPEPYIVPPPETSELGGSFMSSEWGGASGGGGGGDGSVAGRSSFPGSSYGYGVGVGANNNNNNNSLHPGSTAGRPSVSDRDRRMSTISGSSGTNTNTGTGYGYDRPSTPQTSFTTATGASTSGAGMGMRKSAAPPVMRPVNIIQHEDAGAPPPPMDDDNEDGQEPETVELPPAYTNLKPNV